MTGAVCGNCGEVVTADAITCTHCGVLLAAYLPAAGSEALTIVMPESPDASVPPDAPEPPSPTVSPASPPTSRARPVSASPIGDALRQSHVETRDALEHEPLTSREVADDLAAMASGDDDLASMADGDDDLATMADGNDELAAMAGRTHADSFEAAVNAELAGAKVVFDGDKPVIEGEAVEVVDPGDGAVVIEQPAQPSPPPAARPVQSPPRDTPARRPAPAQRGASRVAPATSPQPTPVSAPASGSATARPELGKIVGPLMAIPFLLIVCLIIGAGQGVAGFMVVSLLTTAVIIFLLVRVARMATRKTSTMVRDDR